MKKTFGGILFSLLAVLIIAGCGTGDDTSGSDSGSDSEGSGDDLLSAIQERGTLIVGTSADYAPFEFHILEDGQDKIVGLDIDIAQAIADELGVELQVEDMDFEGLLPAMSSGSVDIILAGMSATEERRQSVDFSDVYYINEQSVIVLAENADEYNSIESLAGLEVGAQSGTTQEEIANEQLPESTLVSLARIPNLILEVQNGSLAAVVIERTVGQGYVDANDDLAFADVPVEYDDNGVAVALPQDEEALKELLNSTIATLQEDGSIDRFMQENTELAEQAVE